MIKNKHLMKRHRTVTASRQKHIESGTTVLSNIFVRKNKIIRLSTNTCTALGS